MVDWGKVWWAVSHPDLDDDTREMLELAAEAKDRDTVEYVLYNHELPAEVELALAEAVEG
ncbi:MAG: hypothetical protein ACXQT2_04470 [Methanotrichaceae archaeon]